jgi:O-antigen/teichoic acid export membrane protein
MTLTQRSLTAVFWSAGDLFLRQGLQFVVSIILARLLIPEDFGLIAMLYIFNDLALLLIDSGFNSALIQSQTSSNEDESTVFFFNIGSGILLALILCVSAPFIAGFFTQHKLQDLVYVMALNLFISAFGSIQTTLMHKKLDFKTPMKIGGVAGLISGIFAVILAWQDFGVMSLALQILTATVISTGLLWYWNPWRPQLIFSMASAKALSGFGGFMLLSGIFDTLYNRIYNLLIGKLFSISDLGLYSRAYGTQQLPIGILSSIIGRVALPAFSASANDKIKLRNGMHKAIVLSMLINSPIMFGLAITAEPLVLTLFGEKWIDCVPLLSILCFAGILWPLHVINLNVLMAQGHSRQFFRLEIIKKILGVITILATISFSLPIIVWGQVFASIISFFVNAYYSKIFLKYSAWQQIVDVLPCILIGAIMALFLLPLSAFTLFTPVIKLLLMTLLGAIFYFLLCWGFKLKAVRILTEITGQRIIKLYRIFIIASVLIVIGCSGFITWSFSKLGHAEILHQLSMPTAYVDRLLKLN